MLHRFCVLCWVNWSGLCYVTSEVGRSQLHGSKPLIVLACLLWWGCSSWKRSRMCKEWERDESLSIQEWGWGSWEEKSAQGHVGFEIWLMFWQHVNKNRIWGQGKCLCVRLQPASSWNRSLCSRQIESKLLHAHEWKQAVIDQCEIWRPIFCRSYSTSGSYWVCFVAPFMRRWTAISLIRSSKLQRTSAVTAPSLQFLCHSGFSTNF